MINVWLLLYVLLGHWVADFLCQARWMAENKYRDWHALCAHAIMYGFVMFAWIAIGFVCASKSISEPLMKSATDFAVMSMLMHMTVDAITSRITHKLWDKKCVKGFFDVIGLDQFIHSACLVWAIVVCFGGNWQ